MVFCLFSVSFAELLKPASKREERFSLNLMLFVTCVSAVVIVCIAVDFYVSCVIMGILSGCDFFVYSTSTQCLLFALISAYVLPD